MSGIIGGAGSKSGVIGTTELDYEEGDWTPINSSYSGSFAGHYIKIGKSVTLWGSLTFNATSTAGTAWTGLPFDAVASPPTKGYGGSANWDIITTSGTDVTPRLGNATSFTFFGSSSATNWNNTFNVLNNSQMKFTIIYHTP